MTTILKFSKHLIENNYAFIMFLMVGSFSAGIYFLLFTILSIILHGKYQVAVSISYVICVCLNFTANRTFTFNSRKKSLSHQLPRYLVLLLINYMITLAMMYLTVERFHYPPYVGIILMLVLSFVLNYIISKLWIF